MPPLQGIAVVTMAEPVTGVGCVTESVPEAGVHPLESVMLQIYPALAGIPENTPVAFVTPLKV